MSEADTGTHVAATEPSEHDVCECQHLRFAHHGGHCMTSLQKTGKGSVTATSASICPCSTFRPVGIRWVPPDVAEDRKLLKIGKRRAEHPLSL